MAALSASSRCATTDSKTMRSNQRTPAPAPRSAASPPSRGPAGSSHLGRMSVTFVDSDRDLNEHGKDVAVLARDSASLNSAPRDDPASSCDRALSASGDSQCNHFAYKQTNKYARPLHSNHSHQPVLHLTRPRTTTRNASAYSPTSAPLARAPCR
jgi:hypothetical protein